MEEKKIFDLSCYFKKGERIPVDLGPDLGPFDKLYSVDTYGNIYSKWYHPRERKLTPSKSRKLSNKEGETHKEYTILKVKLYDGNKVKYSRSVGRIVLESFSRKFLKEVYNLDNVDFGNLTVDHINFDTSDNSISNLQWLSREDNIRKKRNNSDYWNEEELREYCRLFFIEKIPTYKIAEIHHKDPYALGKLFRGISCNGFVFKYCESMNLNHEDFMKVFNQRNSVRKKK